MVKLLYWTALDFTGVPNKVAWADWDALLLCPPPGSAPVLDHKGRVCCPKWQIHLENIVYEFQNMSETVLDFNPASQLIIEDFATHVQGKILH